MGTALLVDGHSLLFRAYHALPPLTRADGVPTGAVYGFATALLKAIEDVRPGRVVVAFDSAEPTFRHEAYAEYKAQREAAPPDFHVQVPLAEQLLTHLGIVFLRLPGFEADDILGTLALQMRAENNDVLILTGDRDLLQLVRPGILVLLTGSGGFQTLQRLDRDGVKAKLGVWPEQVPDFKGLMGDASDNIPGVPGIGQKSAVSLLDRYPTIEAIYDDLSNITEARIRKALDGQREQALKSRALATIRTDVPLGPLPELPEPYRVPVSTELAEFLQAMGFQSLHRRLFAQDREAGTPPVAPAAPETAVGEPWAVWPETRLVGVVQEPSGGFLVADPDSGRVGPWHGPIAPWASQRVVGFGVKDWADAVPPERRLQVDDGVIAAYLLDAGRTRYRIADLLAAVGAPPGDDVLALVRAWERVEARLQELGLWTLYREVEMPLVWVLRAMERRGIRVDREALAELGRELDEAMARTEDEVYTLAGRRFNIQSPPQLAEVLFDILGLPAQRRTKTGYSTDAESLEALRPLHPVVDAVLSYRQLAKLKGTYVDGLAPLIAEDGRLHTHFNQTVAATGRLSSSEPNLQNIPVRLPLGRRVRRVFLPSPGSLLVAADYSQIELRILAHLSDDPVLQDAFRQGQDIHRRTASEMFQVPLELVTPELRNRAKAINFGIIYGISDFGLANNTGVTRQEAAEFIQQYFRRYPRIKAYMDATLDFARQHGYVQTLLGRRRYLPDIASRNYARRQYAERMAMNTPIQGTAADLIKVAMVRLERAFQEAGLKSSMVLQVHDELIWDVVPEEQDTVQRLAVAMMSSALPLSVPLQVDVKCGPHWDALEPVTVRSAEDHAGTAGS
jgi:DNA polymerase-1